MKVCLSYLEENSDIDYGLWCGLGVPRVLSLYIHVDFRPGVGWWSMLAYDERRSANTVWL